MPDYPFLDFEVKMKRSFVLTLFVLVAMIGVGCASTRETGSDLLGKEAPDFILENALGGQAALSDYDGMPVLLYFHMAVG